jgi:hypothetical protein
MKLLTYSEAKHEWEIIPLDGKAHYQTLQTIPRENSITTVGSRSYLNAALWKLDLMIVGEYNSLAYLVDTLQNQEVPKHTWEITFINEGFHRSRGSYAGRTAVSIEHVIESISPERRKDIISIIRMDFAR